MEKETVYARVVAGVVIEKEGKHLLVQEKKPQVYGQWNLPAGKVDVGDTLEQTAIKEAKEEVGFDVKLICKIGIFQQNAEDAVKHAYKADVIGGKLTFPKDEILDARWFSLDEIKAMRNKLRGEGWVIEAIEGSL